MWPWLRFCHGVAPQRSVRFPRVALKHNPQKNPPNKTQLPYKGGPQLHGYFVASANQPWLLNPSTWVHICGHAHLPCDAIVILRCSDFPCPLLAQFRNQAYWTTCLQSKEGTLALILQRLTSQLTGSKLSWRHQTHLEQWNTEALLGLYICIYTSSHTVGAWFTLSW